MSASNPPPLNLSKAVANVWPLQIALLASTAVGVTLGLTIVGFVLILGAFATTAGLAGPVLLVALTGAALAKLIAFGIGAIFIIPVAAVVAARLKLARAEEFILLDARPQPPAEGSRVGELLAYAARQAGLMSVPAYGILENEFNAFAMSSDRAVGMVMMGRPLIDGLSPRETFAVMCHEVGHIAMLDSQRKYLAMGHQQFLVRFLGWRGLKRFALTIFGFIGEFALAAHSREREYWADAVGAYIAGKEQMIGALESLSGTRHRRTHLERDYGPMMIRPMVALFSTHPTFKQRIAALENETYIQRLPLA
jgi:heat shock protein HtpX